MSVCFDYVNFGHYHALEIGSTLALERAELRRVDVACEDSAEELLNRVVVVVDLLRQTGVVCLDLLMSHTVGQDTLGNQLSIGEQMSHIVGVGFELSDDRLDNNHRNGVID